ncbi:MAG: alcohol dehydrogenase [Deltaproteobacteria bacterium HGW-Deltaproteobacteria-15]|jgi:alcohol dehydrogenase|nr:MAG: alcohol dehydrogenase [Deltaproteobacteria bacterium HGW-Deltaproteobacteria-15]
MFQSFPFNTPLIQFGFDTIKQLGPEVEKLGSKRALVITGPTIAKSDILEKATASLKSRSIDFDVNIQGRDTPEPGTHIAEESSRIAKEGNFEVIIGLGGGSILDVAKMASALLTNPGKTRDYFGKEKVTKRGRPTVMIPTTSGTGAEVTKHAIFLDTETHVKKAVASNALLPNVAIVDPSLSVGCPPAVTASSGIDAWIHAAEPYMSKNANPVTDAIGLEAIRIITRWLGPAFADGEDLEARYYMSLGSMMSGLVLNNSGTSLVHAMAYPIGGEYHVPHGVSLCGILIACFESIIVAKPERFARLAEAMGENIEGLSLREASEVALDAMYHLLRSVRLPVCLPDAGITDESKAAKWAPDAHAERRLLTRCVRNLSVSDIEEIYRNAFKPRECMC